MEIKIEKGHFRMEIIVRVCIFWEYVKTFKARQYCKKIITQYESFIKEKDKYIVEFNIPISTTGCRELIEEIQQIENRYEEVGDMENCYIGLLLPLKKYTKKDLSKAVAFQILWGSFVSGYESLNTQGVFWDYCCDDSRWYDGGQCGVQIGNYRMSHNQLKNKKYAITDVYDYVVSHDIKQLLLEIGAVEKDFRPVLSKDDEVVCWQITPQNVVHGMAKDNGWNQIEGCLNCKKKTYRTNKYDYLWMSEEVYNQIGPLNKTEETFGRRFQPDIIVNKEVFEALKKECPRMTFEPIFLKE